MTRPIMDDGARHEKGFESMEVNATAEFTVNAVNEEAFIPEADDGPERTSLRFVRGHAAKIADSRFAVGSKGFPPGADVEFGVIRPIFFWSSSGRAS